AEDGVETDDELESSIAAAQAAGTTWQALAIETRSKVLIRIGDHLAASRADLIEVMGAETDKTIDQSDPEVSEGIDFARYYGQQCLELDNVAGATAYPVGLTVVTPPWNFPVAKIGRASCRASM